MDVYVYRLMKLFGPKYRERALNGPFGLGPKSTIVNSLIIRGIDFNDLKPGSVRRRRGRRLGEDIFLPDDSGVIEDAVDFMKMYGVSVEEMKEGTFYSVLEKGKNLDGQDITQEEAQRIIKETNHKLRNRFYNKPPVKKMTKEEIARAWELLEELRRSIDTGKDKIIEEKEEEIGPPIPPPPPHDDDVPAVKSELNKEEEFVGPSLPSGDDGSGHVFKYMKRKRCEDEEEGEEKKKKMIVGHP